MIFYFLLHIVDLAIEGGATLRARLYVDLNVNMDKHNDLLLLLLHYYYYELERVEQR